MEYQGEILPKRDPRLTLKYTFNDNGTSELYWTYDEGQSFCHRKGLYLYNEAKSILEDISTWINPNNKADCSMDPDMQLGKRSVTPISWTNCGKLKTEIPLGNETIYYVWEKTVQEGN